MRQALTLMAVLAATAAAHAQQPKVANASLSVREGAGLQATISAAQTATWIGYSVPVTHPTHTNWSDSVEYLESRPKQEYTPPVRKPGDPIPRTDVLLRVSAGKVEKVRIEDPDRALDAGGLPFVWLGALKPQESISVLSGVVEQAAKNVPSENGRQDHEQASARSLLENGILAIALEDAPEATTPLVHWTDANYSLTVRDRAAFWLANERGRAGFDTIAKLLRDDASDEFRRKLLFDLTLCKGDEAKAALEELLRVAKSDRSPKVQSQAQFWLAQIASRKIGDDPRIVRTLAASVEGDPAISKSAVFAISRLPADQGVPELIHVASTSSSTATRKEAVFWLGQSKDARAIAYIEKVARGQ